MKLIKAYIRPVMIDQVIRELEKIKAPRMTAIDVRVVGNEVNDDDGGVSVEYGTTYSNMVKLEIICTDEKVASIVETIKKNAKTGKEGDGIIAVSAIEKVTSILSGKDR